MTIVDGLILFVAAFLGGALNSVAGGGSFIAFPALVFTGVDVIHANATNTVALWPGSVASVGAYRRELAAQRRELVLLGSVSLVGGILGALLLLRTPKEIFSFILPYLLLVATLLFTFGKRLTDLIKKSQQGHHTSLTTLIGVATLQFVISIYGGFFGGGIGILMLAALTLIGMENIHNMNALKTLLASLINGVAVLLFIVNGVVEWPQAILMVIAAIIGGYGGAHYARQLDPLVIRRFVIVVGFTMTIYFFIRSFTA